MPITKEQKQEIIAKYGSHAKDSGKRKRLLKYLKESDITRYREALEKFDLRK